MNRMPRADNELAARPAVLSCEGVCRWGDTGSGGFNLALRAGDCVVFASVPPGLIHDPGDLFLGLGAPRRGTVRYGGVDWQGMDPRESERCRRQIGRVLAAPGRAAWLQNLDVEENVFLARTFEPGFKPENLQRRCELLCERFGLDALPATRPSATPGEALARSQWVRAFLPDPLRLVILECPESGVTAEAASRLRNQVRRARSEGVAVVWIDTGSPVGLDETMRYDTLPPWLRRRAS